MKQTDFPLVFLLWGAGLGAAAQYAKVSVVFAQLPELYPQAGAWVGLSVSLVGAIGIILGVVAGVLVSRLGYRRTLLAALWAGAAISAFQALVPPFATFLALRVLEGMSHLALVVALPTLIAQVSAPQHRGFTLTLWGTFFGVAFALLAFLGMPLVARFGVAGLFAAHAAYMAVFALILAAVVRPLERTEPAELPSLAQTLSKHRAVYRSSSLPAPAFGWLFYTFCFVAVLTVIPPFIAEADRTWVMGSMPLASILSSMTLGVFLMRYISAVYVCMLGFITAAVAMLWLWAAPGLPLACVALAACLGLIQGASFAAVPQLANTATEQAEANGAMAQMGNLGNTLGTPIMALALASFGYQALPLLIGFMLVMGALAHLLMAARRKAV